MLNRLLLALIFSAGTFVSAENVFAKNCPQMQKCRGCGCAGGPGYRGPTGCVSWLELYKVCGNPPDRCCAFENAPNTGVNKQCALEGFDEAKLKSQAKTSACTVPKKKFNFD